MKSLKKIPAPVVPLNTYFMNNLTEAEVTAMMEDFEQSAIELGIPFMEVPEEPEDDSTTVKK